VSTDTLSVEEHLEWLLCSIETAHSVVTLSGSPSDLPQFDDEAQFRNYLARRFDDIRRHANAIKQALPATCLRTEAPWPPM
jgi:hypothetical protein